jgi:hypothetical protein
VQSPPPSGLALGRSVAQLVVDRAKTDGSQFESIVTGMTFIPSKIKPGDSFSATITGNYINQKTYFDIRLLRPGSTTEEIGINWQLGTTANHAISVNAATGRWRVTGIRRTRSSEI